MSDEKKKKSFLPFLSVVFSGLCLVMMTLAAIGIFLSRKEPVPDRSLTTGWESKYKELSYRVRELESATTRNEESLGTVIETVKSIWKIVRAPKNDKPVTADAGYRELLDTMNNHNALVLLRIDSLGSGIAGNGQSLLLVRSDLQKMLNTIQSLDIIEPAETEMTDEARQILDEGFYYYRTKEYNTAEGRFRNVLGLCPEHPLALGYLAASLFNRNPDDSSQYTEYEDLCRRAINAGPERETAMAWRVLGEISLLKNEREQGIACLARSLSINPADDDIRHLLGRI